MATSISVVIPTYNRATIVTHAIDSVLAQSVQPDEIVVVDDGSRDNTAEVLRDRYGARVRCVEQPNGGVSSARNNGITAARGDWIAFLDSDDEWLPEKLARQKEAVERREDLVAHVTNAAMVFDEGDLDLFTVRGQAGLGAGGGVLERPFITSLNMQFFTPTFMVRRSTLIEVGLFDTSLSIYEDMDLFGRVATAGPWGVTNEVLVKVFRRGESTNNLSRQHVRKPIKAYESSVRMYSKLAGQERLNSEERAAAAAAISGSRYEMATALLQEGRGAEARRAFWQAARDFPTAGRWCKSLTSIALGRLGVAMIRKVGDRRRGTFRRSVLAGDNS